MPSVKPYPHAAPARIPQDDQTRKDAPMYRGLLGYFPAALFEVATHSLASDRKHNGDTPGGPRWARGKSTDHEDTLVRHLIDAGKRGSPDRRYHLRCLAWRALALLQEDCEADGAEPGVSSVFPETVQSKVAALRHPAETLAIDAFKAEQAAPSEQVGERWGVFRISWEGTSHRSQDLPKEYPSKAAADRAIRAFGPSLGARQVRRFAARQGGI